MKRAVENGCSGVRCTLWDTPLCIKNKDTLCPLAVFLFHLGDGVMIRE